MFVWTGIHKAHTLGPDPVVLFLWEWVIPLKKKTKKHDTDTQLQKAIYITIQKQK